MVSIRITGNANFFIHLRQLLPLFLKQKAPWGRGMLISMERNGLLVEIAFPWFESVEDVLEGML